MVEQNVTFNRVVKKRADFKDVPFIKPLTIDDAKKGLALMFSVDAKFIDITIKG